MRPEGSVPNIQPWSGMTNTHLPAVWFVFCVLNPSPIFRVRSPNLLVKFQRKGRFLNNLPRDGECIKVVTIEISRRCARVHDVDEYVSREGHRVHGRHM